MGTKKEEYIDKMAEQLKEWSAKIDDLESKMTGTTADVKAGYENRIRELKEKRDELSRKLRELGDAGGEAWDTLKTGADIAWKDLRDAITAARDKFRKVS